MKKIWLGAILLLASCAASVPCFAQAPPIKPRFVILDDYIREQLAKDWEEHEHDTVKLERAYCVRWQLDFWAGEPTYRVTQISAPDSVDADESSISFSCSHDTDVAEIHIHPATSCYDDKLHITRCWEGGPYAWQCAPSDADRNYVLYVRQPFGIVQCDKHATVFYFATGDNR